MAQALTYLYDIYSAFLNMIFNTFEITTDVTIGWIMIVFIVFSLMINNILNLPKSAPKMKGK